MSLIAGITGQPAELMDGAKVNSLLEYTVGNGVQHQGRTNGVAIEAYKVGEKVTNSGFPIQQVLTTSYADWTSATMTIPSAGVWLVCLNCSISVENAASNAQTVTAWVTDAANNTQGRLTLTAYFHGGATAQGADFASSHSVSDIITTTGSLELKVRAVKSTAVLYGAMALPFSMYAVRIA